MSIRTSVPSNRDEERNDLPCRRSSRNSSESLGCSPRSFEFWKKSIGQAMNGRWAQVYLESPAKPKSNWKFCAARSAIIFVMVVNGHGLKKICCSCVSSSYRDSMLPFRAFCRPSNHSMKDIWASFRSRVKLRSEGSTGMTALLKVWHNGQRNSLRSMS